MKYFKLIINTLSLLLLVSCTHNEATKPGDPNKGDKQSRTDEEVIFERPKDPAVDNSADSKKPRPGGKKTDRVTWDLKYLGFSYWFNGEELIESELKDSIINIRTLIKDPQLEGSITISPRPIIDIRTQVFRNYRETCTENPRLSKVRRDFRPKLAECKQMHKLSSPYRKIFDRQSSDFDNALFGEADLYVYLKDVKLSESIVTRADIMERHLYPSFIQMLYNKPIGVISSSIGPLVLCKYSLGGKLSAKYLYINKEKESLEASYDLFREALNLTFYPKSNSRLYYNNNNIKKLLDREKDQKLYLSLQTIGGSTDHQIDIQAVDRDKFDGTVDVSSWIHSLSDIETNTIIDIQDNGLVPITDFILESNFRRRLMDIYKGVLEANTENQTPKIEVSNVYVRHSESGQVLCDIALVLNTRNGDKLILTNVNEKASDDELLLNKSRDEYIRKGQQLAASVSHIFKGIKKSGKPDKILYPDLRTTLCANAVVDFNHLKKYQNPYTKVVYLYDEESKVALSYYHGEGGDKNLEEEYGLTDFARDLPEKKISILNLLQNYQVLGL